MDTKALNLKINASIYKQLERAAQSTGKSKKQIVEDAIENYLWSTVVVSTDNDVDSDLIPVDSDDNVDATVEARIRRLEFLQDDQEQRIAAMEKRFFLKLIAKSTASKIRKLIKSCKKVIASYRK